MSQRAFGSEQPPGRSAPAARKRRETGDPPSPLRLTVTRGVLGLELYEPVELGPLRVVSLAVALTGLKFPVDLSGGIPAFRHRRGDLERVEVAIGRQRLGRFLEPRLRAVLGGLDEPPRLWPHEQGLGVGLLHGRQALAFDVLWAPDGGDLALLVANARGAGLSGPAMAYALRAVDSALGKWGHRKGRRWVVPELARRLACSVMPVLGARAPAAGRVRVGELRAADDELGFALDAAFAPAVLTPDALRTLELSGLCQDAEEALGGGSLDEARAGYLRALEQAPRHPELCRAIAAIDLAAGDRAEGALGLLVEGGQAVLSGAVAAALLARCGDPAAARSALAVAAQAEPFAPLAALWLAESAGHAISDDDRLSDLDHAVARAPALAAVRLDRLTLRLRLGQIDGALQDAEQLEAAARGARARFDGCRLVAELMLEAGFAREAGRQFERALRYVPDDVECTAGLGRALLRLGQPDRALSLFERAARLAEARQAPADVLIDLAKLLASHRRDLPQAIARVRQVRGDGPRRAEAVRWEAHWLASIGDLAGASLAYARLRERLAEQRPPDPNGAEWLLEAGRFEREQLGDVLAAERHLSVALRMAPRSERVARAYREVAALAAGLREPGPLEPEAVLPPLEDGPGVTDLPGEVAAPPPADESLEQLAAAAERLQAAVRANPEAIEDVLRLASVLEQLCRDQDLLALLAGQIEDAAPRERARLLPPARAVLLRLVAAAEAAGQPSERDLYQSMLDRISADDGGEPRSA